MDFYVQAVEQRYTMRFGLPIIVRMGVDAVVIQTNNDNTVLDIAPYFPKADRDRTGRYGGSRSTHRYFKASLPYSVALANEGNFLMKF